MLSALHLLVISRLVHDSEINEGRAKESSSNVLLGTAPPTPLDAWRGRSIHRRAGVLAFELRVYMGQLLDSTALGDESI